MPSIAAKYFEPSRPGDKPGTYKSKCKLCAADVATKGNTTSNLLTHLRRKHPSVHGDLNNPSRSLPAKIHSCEEESCAQKDRCCTCTCCTCTSNSVGEPQAIPRANLRKSLKMKLIHDTEERVRSGLKEAISLLCKTGLNFTSQLSIDGLLGITLDHDEVFLVSIKEIIKNPQDFSVTSSSSKSDESREKETTHSRRKAPTSTISRFGSSSVYRHVPGSDSQGTYLRTSPHKRLQPVESSHTYPGRSKRARASAEHAPRDSHSSKSMYGCVDLSSDDSQNDCYDTGYSNALEPNLAAVSPETGASNETESSMASKNDPIDLSGCDRAWNTVRITDSEPEVLHSPAPHMRDVLVPEAEPIEVSPIGPHHADDASSKSRSSEREIKCEQRDESSADMCVIKEEPNSNEQDAVIQAHEHLLVSTLPSSPGSSIATSSAGVAPVVDPEAHAVWLQSIAAFVQQPSVLHPFADTSVSHSTSGLMNLSTQAAQHSSGSSHHPPNSRSQFTSRLPYSSQSQTAESAKRFGSSPSVARGGAAGGGGASQSTDREQPFLIMRQGMTCSNCGTSKTTTWRRSVEGNPMCNACGLYYKLHKSHSPRASKSAPQCANCGTNVTTMWRRNDKGEPVCNACGLYYKLHKVNRPLSMVKGEIHCRRRQKKPSTYRSSWLGASEFHTPLTSASTSTSPSSISKAKSSTNTNSGQSPDNNENATKKETNSE